MATEQDMLTFILGAGFNIDATQEAGPFFADSLYEKNYRVDCRYPLVADIIQLCFGERVVEGKSVEKCFAEALERGDYAPLTVLLGCLHKADYYIANRLASDAKTNSYKEFLQTFAGSNFLTFNYDSLPETILYRLKLWYPHDG